MRVSRMLVVAAGLVACISCGCRAETKEFCKSWDDDYVPAISEDTSAQVQELTSSARNQLRNFQDAWSKSDEYATVHDLMAEKMPHAVSGIRLELGGTERYRFIWGFEDEDGVHLHTNQDGSHEQYRLNPERWRRFVAEVTSLGIRTTRSHGDVVYDGVGYYVSFCSEGEVSQFALYTTPESVWGFEATQRAAGRLVFSQEHRALVSAILNLARSEVVQRK